MSTEIYLRFKNNDLPFGISKKLSLSWTGVEFIVSKEDIALYFRDPGNSLANSYNIPFKMLDNDHSPEGITEFLWELDRVLVDSKIDQSPYDLLLWSRLMTILHLALFIGELEICI